MNLQRLDPVVFRYNGYNIRGRILQLYSEFGQAVRCEDMKGQEYIVRQCEVMSECAYEDQLASARVARAREKYQPIVDAYKACDGKISEMAKLLKSKPQIVGIRVRAAKRRGLL